jgi:hypothetical protein
MYPVDTRKKPTPREDRLALVWIMHVYKYDKIPPGVPSRAIAY